MPQFRIVSNTDLGGVRKERNGGGEEQQELLDESISIDSSIQAWSEDGHRDHITEGWKRRNAELSRKSSVKERRRSSPIVNGSLILSAGRSAACNSSESSLLKRRHPTKSKTMSIATLPPRNLNILSTLAQLNNRSTTPRASSSFSIPPCRSSSASFTSPLSQFPSIPARGEKGVLMNKVFISQIALPEMATGTPTTAKPSLQFPTYHGLRNGPLVVKNASPLIRQLSQTRVDDSPLDTPSMTAKRWTIEQDSPMGRTASTMIDSLLQGVQKSAVTDTLVVDSPLQTDFSGRDEEEGEETEEWETEDCAMTPQLVRGRWQDLSPVASKQEECTVERVNEHAQVVAVKKVITKRQSSFLEIPSCIFPHTPARVESSTSLRRQTSIGIRRRSNCSLASVASSTSKSKRGSRSYRNSALLSATVTTTTATGKRRSVHAVSTPRIVCRKSKYYSRQPRESGVVPPIVQQHIQGARGKFWSPLNKKRQSSSDIRATLSTLTAAAESSSSSARFSRRSGQAWLQPKTIENRSEFKVTVYPPQVERPTTVNKSDIVITVEDTDRTPTQALFKRVTLTADAKIRSSSRTYSSSNTSTSTTSDHGKPRIPPPAVSLPALPSLDEARSSSFARDVRRSLRSSRALSLLSCSCTGSSSFSGTCSCTTTGSRASQASAYSDYTACSCTDQSGCSCTEELSSSSSVVRSSDDDSSFSIRVAERTTPLSAPIREASMGGFGGNYPEPPHSAPFYSSLRPPVLDPLPRLSPFRVDFFLFDNEGTGLVGGVKDKLSKRYSVFSSASTCLTCSTVCTTSSQCSECRRLQRSSQRICSQTIYNALTSDRTSRAVILDVTDSPSFDSSPENGMESDLYSSSSSSSSTQDSELPLTPPRSEYHDNIHVESPGYRVSLIVSPIPSSVKEEKAMAGELYSSYNSSVDSDLSYLADESPSLSSGSSSSDSDLETASVQQSRISYYTSTTTTASSSNVTSRGPPRSILKTSRTYQISEEGERGPKVALSLATSSSAFSSAASPQKKRTTGVSFQPAVKPSSERYAQRQQEPRKVPAMITNRQDESSTRPPSPEDLERRIKREDHRRVRNESRLYALDKLEGKEKRSSLFSAVASTSNQSGSLLPTGNVGFNKSTTRNEAVSMTGWQEVGDDDDDDTFSATPLTPIQRDLIELEKQAQRRQQEQIKTAPTSSPSVVDYTPSAPSFDMFVCPKLFTKKNKNKSNKSSSTIKTPLERQQDERLKTQLKKLGTAVEVRQIARDRCIDR